MNTWTIDAFITNLAATIQADSEWAALSPAITVFDYFPSEKQQNGDWLAVGVDLNDTPTKEVADGPTRSRDEAVSIDCLLAVRRGGSGAAPSGSARTAAVTAEHHIDRILRTTPTADMFGQPVTARVRPHITSRAMSQYASDRNGVAVRIAMTSFTIAYSVRTTPT